MSTLDKLCKGSHHPTLLDVGSGAGLPGIPLAIARPAWRLSLIDSAEKKAAFCRQACAELGLENVKVIHGRVQDQPKNDSIDANGNTGFDIVISRAF